MINFNCPTCSFTIQVPDTMSGKAGNCPKCRERLSVPSAVGMLDDDGEVADNKFTNKKTINKQGAWCPQCKNRDSKKHVAVNGCLMMLFILVTLGLALIILAPFLPHEWRCNVCKNAWKA